MKILEDENSVSICCNNVRSSLDGFIDIYPEDEHTPSLFKTKKECRLFAEIIVKLLESIND